MDGSHHLSPTTTQGYSGVHSRALLPNLIFVRGMQEGMLPNEGRRILV